MGNRSRKSEWRCCDIFLRFSHSWLSKSKWFRKENQKTKRGNTAHREFWNKTTRIQCFIALTWKEILFYLIWFYFLRVFWFFIEARNVGPVSAVKMLHTWAVSVCLNLVETMAACAENNQPLHWHWQQSTVSRVWEKSQQIFIFRSKKILCHFSRNTKYILN